MSTCSARTRRESLFAGFPRVPERNDSRPAGDQTPGGGVLAPGRDALRCSRGAAARAGLAAWLFLFLTLIRAEEKDRFFLFDMGTQTSAVERNYIRVTEKTVYSTQQGYGWEKEAEGAFDRPRAKAANTLTRDGVISKDDLVFKVKLKPAKYYLRIRLGDPQEVRENMSVYVLEQPLARKVTTKYTWWRGEPTSMLLSGTVGLPEKMLIFRFLHDGTANSVQSIEILPEKAPPFDPLGPKEQLPDEDAFEPLTNAVNACRIGDFGRALDEAEQVFEPESSFYKAWFLTWLAGRIDSPGNCLEVLQKAQEILHSTLLRAPGHAQALKRYLVNQDYIRAIQFLDMQGYTEFARKTGTGWGERRKTAQNLLQQISPGDPLYFQAILNLGKVSYWVGQEADSPFELANAAGYFREVQKAFPGSPLVRMYLGEKVAWGQEYNERRAQVPLWAARQREALARLNDVIDYWVQNRQAENGEFGGGWGDDVELMRWWMAAAVVTGSDKLTASIAKLADGIWTKSGIIGNGFFRGLAEVQYAAEPTSDTQPIMIALREGDPKYLERCLGTARLMRDLWTGLNPQRHRLFKSIELGSTRIGNDPAKGLDVPYHARAIQPAQWVAWYNRSPALIKLFKEWGDSWVAASQSTAKKKPLGLPPAAIAFETGEIGGHENVWYNPKLGPIYFNFPGGLHLLLEQLLATYVLSGDAKYLEPIEACINLLNRFTRGKSGRGEVGSAQWAARVLLSSKPLRQVWAKWRILTGKKTYDAFLREYGAPYIKWYLTGDKTFLVEGCLESINSLSSNFELLTSEVRYTDRVRVEGIPHLMAMGTGGPGVPGCFPAWKATWETGTRNFACLVLHDSDEEALGQQKSLRALLYNFEPQFITVRLKVWSLAPGEYELTRGPDTNRDDRMDGTEDQQSFRVFGPGSSIKFSLPPGSLQVVALKRVRPFADAESRLRPDVAISSEDVFTVPARPAPGERMLALCRVHNVGTAPARQVLVQFYEGSARLDNLIKESLVQQIDPSEELTPRPGFAWAILSAKSGKHRISVSARTVGASITNELSAGNNQADGSYASGKKRHAAFNDVFWKGKLSATILPVWLECADLFLGTGRSGPLGKPRAAVLKAQLARAQKGAGAEEVKMINQLRLIIAELQRRK